MFDDNKLVYLSFKLNFIEFMKLLINDVETMFNLHSMLLSK